MFGKGGNDLASARGGQRSREGGRRCEGIWLRHGRRGMRVRREGIGSKWRMDSGGLDGGRARGNSACEV